MAKAPHRSKLETRPNYIFLDHEDALIALLIFFCKKHRTEMVNPSFVTFFMLYNTSIFILPKQEGKWPKTGS